jgi:transposase-like protein
VGAPSGLANPDILQVLLAAITDGVSYESACRSAGIAPRTIYNWKTRAEAGDEAAKAFVHALEKAEADTERRAVRNTLKAGESPQFWAANMTYLERKYPEKWGRRQDDSAGPKVQVIIGASESEVRVNVIANYQTPNDLAPTDSLCKPLLSEGESLAPVVIDTPSAAKKPARGRRGARSGGGP